MPIHIYAEHLINIQALRIQVTLPTPSNEHTQAQLSPGGTEVRVRHDGEKARVRLPIRLVGKVQTLTIPNIPSSTLSYRFQAGTTPDVLQHALTVDNCIPWTATQLTAQTTAVCSGCNTTIVARERIMHWKDLPTETWAEMMEFWHCHKPAEPDSGTRSMKKGYSAMSKLNLQPGTGLLTATTILLANEDVEYIEAHPDSNHALCCKQCKKVLGRRDSQHGATRLYKQALAISRDVAMPVKSFPAEKWLACALLNATETQGVSKLTIIDDDSASDTTSVWIFTPEMCVSTTAGERGGPFRAMKVMWMSVPSSETPSQAETMSRETLATGSIELSYSEHRQALLTLERSCGLLPADMQGFQDWRVALLPKFTSHDLD